MTLTKMMVGLQALVLAAAVQAGDIVVVVSAKNPVTTLAPEQVAHIFLAQTARLPDGAEVAAIDQPIGSELRDRFYSKVTGMSPTLVKSYWTKMVFTGRGQPPKVVDGSIAIRKLVAENPLLIGYIDRTALDDSVREVFAVK